MELRQQNDDIWLTGPFVIGHRGAPLMAPDNSVLGMKHVRRFVEGAEFDVHISSDGVPVVTHDDEVETISGKKLALKNLTFYKLSSNCIGPNQSQFLKDPLPSLKAILAALPRGSIANVELKKTGNFIPDEYLKKVVEVMGEFRLRYIVSSFDQGLIEHFASKKFNISTGIVFNKKTTFEEIKTFCQRPVGIDSIHLPVNLATGDVVLWAKERGFHVVVWTVNHLKRAKKLIQLGVAGLITDDIEKINLNALGF